MKYAFAALGALAFAGPAFAQDLDIKPYSEARIRYENVDDDSIAKDADALTLRVRGGATARSGVFSATVAGQGTLAAVSDYNDGLNGPATRPLVADPQNIALYLANVQLTTKAFALTGGRQKIVMDDERFVGNVAFRDNAQTFDALRAELTLAKGLKLDLTYAWSVRTIWGIDGRGARQQAVGGDNVFANLSYGTPLGTIAGFAYLVDQDEAAVQGYRLSSQTYGARFSGKQALSNDVRLSYQASYARQTDYHHNPNDYAADYWLADAALDVMGWTVNAGYEVLGAGNGTPFTSFQTPLGTNFKFQGWADKFLTTPPNGIRDFYAGGGYGVKELGPLKGVSLQAVWHRYDSDRADLRYGEEWNLIASAKVRKTAVSVRFADYDARDFSANARKIWIQADWVY